MSAHRSCCALPMARDLVFVQIAGLVARRIICDLKPEQAVNAGERYGLIRFGAVPTSTCRTASSRR